MLVDLVFILKFVLGSLEILCEVFQQKHFLVDLFGHCIESVLVNLLLSAGGIAFNVGDHFASNVAQHLGIVVEVNSARAVRQGVA